MTYEKYEKFIVDGNLFYSGVNQKVEIDDSLKGYVFYQYRNSNSSDNVIFEQNLYYDTDIKDTSYTSEIKIFYSESYFRNQYPEFKDMVFKADTFYVFSPFLYSSRHITHFRNVPYSSMEEAYHADYNEIFPNGIETILLDPKGKNLSGVIVLNDSDMDKIVERYHRHSDILFLPGKDDFRMARFISDHYLSVQADKDMSKRTRTLIETYNANTSGYYVSIFTYGLLSFFFFL